MCHTDSQERQNGYSLSGSDTNASAQQRFYRVTQVN
jgi:hypothetical protein